MAFTTEQQQPSAVLPSTHRALILTSTSTPPTVCTIPTPPPIPGSAVVRILATPVISYMRDVYDGTRPYPFPTPFVPGCSAVGRVVAIGPDAVAKSTRPGQLVLVGGLIRARDDSDIAYLSGMHQGFTPESAVLMRDAGWRDSTFAEYARVPLESVHALDEEWLTGDKGLGYSLNVLTTLPALLVPYGGLKDVGLCAGETVCVAPATGAFGGAAVRVALAMGAARVVAVGRNEEALRCVQRSSGSRVGYVVITGDAEKDAAAIRTEAAKAGGGSKGVDIFFDISPPQAVGSSHLRSGILALRRGGRMSMMGGIMEDIALPHLRIMHWDLQIRGKWMYEPRDVGGLIGLVQSGLLPLDYVQVVGTFGLDEWKEAWDVAYENAGMGQITVIVP